MRIYYDCEFIDDGRQIIPISIGLKADNGDELYRINSSQSVISRAMSHPWLAENVMPHLPVERLNDVWAWKTSHPHMYNVREVPHIAQDVKHFVTGHGPDVELWSWYGAYDHVMLAQLFGTMSDLPQGFPMYTCDLQQEIDRLGVESNRLPGQDPTLAHSALADACWHKKIGDFLINVETNLAEYPPDYGR